MVSGLINALVDTSWGWCINVPVSLRRIVTAATTVAIAILLALVVPVTQLRLASDAPVCCCPDPDLCKCADHQPEPGTPTMRACHGDQDDVVRTQLPQFNAPVVIAFVRPEQPIAVATIALPDPHPSPAPRRPDAPS